MIFTPAGSWAVLAARIVLGGILVLTGLLKAGHNVELAAAIAGFRLLPAAVIPAMAVALPYVEILLGLYLAIGLFTRAAGWLTCAQMLLYAGAIASAVVRGIPANCGCFGPNDAATADWPHVAFDVALAAVAAFIAAGAPGRAALDAKVKKS
jgi:putative oxidoreductase